MMKKHPLKRTLTDALSVFLLLVASGIPCSAERLSPAMRKEISIPLAQPSTDDYLLSLARAADANIFVDATEFKAEKPLAGEWRFPPTTAEAGQWKGTVAGVVAEIAYLRKLTFLEHKDNTFLFWSDQDFTGLGYKLLADEGIKLKGEVPTDFETAQILTKWLTGSKGWDGQSLDYSVEEPITALPDDLREIVKTRIQAHLLDLDDPQKVFFKKLYFNDDLWKTARIQVINSWPDGSGKPQAPALFIGTDNPIGGKWGVSFGSLGSP
jgi:hypothetical protein